LKTGEKREKGEKDLGSTVRDISFVINIGKALHYYT
jgi:hypothetical protein